MRNPASRLEIDELSSALNAGRYRHGLSDGRRLLSSRVSRHQNKDLVGRSAQDVICRQLYQHLYATLRAHGTFVTDYEVIATILPRSVTAAVGIELSHQLGGTDTITILFIITTGLIGSMLGAYLLKFAKFQTSIARGLTYGNSSHAFGTAKALELDIESGAFSSIGMILTAVLSSVLIPLFILFLY